MPREDASQTRAKRSGRSDCRFRLSRRQAEPLINRERLRPLFPVRNLLARLLSDASVQNRNDCVAAAALSHVWIGAKMAGAVVEPRNQKLRAGRPRAGVQVAFARSMRVPVHPKTAGTLQRSAPYPEGPARVSHDRGRGELQAFSLTVQVALSLTPLAQVPAGITVIRAPNVRPLVQRELVGSGALLGRRGPHGILRCRL
jgi:hypothetical protein